MSNLPSNPDSVSKSNQDSASNSNSNPNTKETLLKEMKPLLDGLFIKIRQEMMKIKIEDLANGQIFLLFLLSKHETCNASDLGKHLGITSGAITGMTDKLVSMNLIIRNRSEEDRRLVLLSLTEKGKATVKDIQEMRYGLLNEIFMQLDDKNIINMIELFTQLNAIMEERNL